MKLNFSTRSLLVFMFGLSIVLTVFSQETFSTSAAIIFCSGSAFAMTYLAFHFGSANRREASARDWTEFSGIARRLISIRSMAVVGVASCWIVVCIAIGNRVLQDSETGASWLAGLVVVGAVGGFFWRLGRYPRRIGKKTKG